MIKLDSTWFLEKDPHCWILLKKTTTQKGKNKGNTIYSPTGYYIRLEQAVKTYLEGISDAKKISSLDDVIATLNKCTQEIVANIEQFNNNDTILDEPKPINPEDDGA